MPSKQTGHVIHLGPDLRKILWGTYENLWNSLTYEKLRMSMWLSKNLMKNLEWSCEKLTTTLQVSYENVKFATSDVIRETLCQRLLLVEYFELKIPDNHNDYFLWKMTYHSPKKILGSRISLSDKKTHKNLMTNLGKILRSFENRAPGHHHQVITCRAGPSPFSVRRDHYPCPCSWRQTYTSVNK